jgi:hypothetical protein
MSNNIDDAEIRMLIHPPRTVPVIEALSKELDCEPKSLQDRLQHPLFRQKADDFLCLRRMRTIYTNHAGQKNEIHYCKLSQKSAHEQHSYEGYLGVTVRYSVKTMFFFFVY